MKRIVLAALLSFAALAAQAQVLSGTLLTSASRSAAVVNSTDRSNNQWRGVQVVVDVSGYTGGSYIARIQGKDAISGNYFNLLSGVSISSVSTNIYTLYPGALTGTFASTASASTVLPATWRLQLTGSLASMTVSASMTLMP